MQFFRMGLLTIARGPHQQVRCFEPPAGASTAVLVNIHDFASTSCDYDKHEHETLCKALHVW